MASNFACKTMVADLVNTNYYFMLQGETTSGIKVYWYYDLKKVPKNFSWYIAHEFFDVLPIHKFEVNYCFNSHHLTAYQVMF